MAEKEQLHRHALQTQDLSSRCKIAERGQIFAMILGGAGTVGGLALAAFNKQFAGLGTFVFSLAILVGIYVSERRRIARELNAQPSNSPQER
jgi:uncharacterized membrane protein